MVRFELTQSGYVSFKPDKKVLARLAAHESRSSAVINAIGLKLGSPDNSNSLHLIRHPASHALAVTVSDPTRHAESAALLNLLSSLDNTWTSRLDERRVTVMQRRELLPSVDTRGESILVDYSAPDGPDFLDEMDQTTVDAAGADWTEFRSIISTVTFIEVPGRPSIPYFSGSNSDLWGAMHMSAPASVDIFAECITHEAAHFWLNLVEEVGELAVCSWDDSRWISPWREDLRPIGGIIHGVFVFSCAATVLACWLMRQRGLQNGDCNKIRARVCKLIAQVEEGIIELERSESLTEIGLEVCRDADARLGALRCLVGSSELADARACAQKLRRIKLDTLPTNRIST